MHRATTEFISVRGARRKRRPLQGSRAIRIGAAAVLALSSVVLATPHAARAAAPADFATHSSWSIETAAGQDGLTTDSCVAAGFCMAVSVSELNGDDADVEGVDIWNGSTWTFQKMAQPVGSSADANSGELLGVSCTAVTACTAVGDFYENDFADDVPLAEFWNGTTWTVSPTPNPAGSSDAGLVSVSCASASSCTAIGNLYDLGHPFIESWNGAKWSVHDQPTVPGFLYGVSCPSASACTAVGYASEGKNVPLIETWNGKTWSVGTVPNPAGSVDSVLSSVSCASTSACTAVGDYYNGSELDSTLVEAWSGGAWAIEPSPNVKGAPHTLFLAVSCSTPTSCSAVGESTNRHRSQSMFVASSNGNVWTRQTAQAVSAGDTWLNGVSCVAKSVCQAVGTVFTGVATPLAEGEGA
jgi:hypothetical protein